MAQDRAKPCELNQEKYNADDNMKIICQWDSTMVSYWSHLCGLFGHSKPGAVPEHTCLLLQGPHLHRAV
uniref:Uncharacterized protein n=1 Tax=Phocoena sinus TaxID=42100 RepID=A0A8C9BQW8_PHOSS